MNVSLLHSSSELQKSFPPVSPQSVAVLIQAESSEVYEQCLRMKN